MNRNLFKFSSPLIALLAVICLATGNLVLADENDPDVVATWTGGIHTLPSSATKSGEDEYVSMESDETPEQWNRRIADLIKTGVKVPAVIYAHGCKGPAAAGTWALSFNEFGFAFFAPDSFKRPGREALCYSGDPHYKFSLRVEEIRFALAEIRKMPWIDQNRLVLFGKSEGGGAVAYFHREGFIAHVITEYDCRINNGSPSAPSGVAVLNIVGANDPKEEICSVTREIGGSKAIALPGLAHEVAGDPNAVAAVATFLKDCCGYKPKSAIADLDPEETAKKLVAEMGELGALHATMKAEELAGKGDEKGQEFWLQVQKIVEQLTGG